MRSNPLLPLNEQQVAFLTANTWSNFFSGLLSQYNRKGGLSERQIVCIDESMQKDKDLPVAPMPNQVPNAPRVFSIKVGEQIEIKRGTANRLKREKILMMFFHNLEVVEVLDETPRGYKLNVRFVSSVCTNCHNCGLPLDTDISRACGIGPVCAKKNFGVKRPTVENAQEVLKLLDKYCLEVGVVEKVWIPKSQIISRKDQAHAPDSDIVAVRSLDDMLGATREADSATVREVWDRAQKDAKGE